MRTDKKLWRNRKARKRLARRLQSANPGLEVVHAHAAGIDIGNSAHFVAVRPDREAQPVRRFECFTADLQRLANSFESCGVQTVALQSTGVYWIPLYDILEERGFKVCLVNARNTKNLLGRKSDVQESQWPLKNCMKTFARASSWTPNQLSPPASISPVPPQVGQSPLPSQAEQADSCPNTMTSSEILSRKAFPVPRQTEQFPSPGESQLGQVWVVILHVATLSAILVWFPATVKTRLVWTEL
jgi:Transposase